MLKPVIASAKTRIGRFILHLESAHAVWHENHVRRSQSTQRNAVEFVVQGNRLGFS
jgi:hypothetical protein